MFDSEADRLRHRRRHPVRQGPAEGPGRRLPQARDQAVLLLLAARLAPPRLLPARQDRPGTPAARRRATGTRTSPTTRGRSASSAPTTARSAASGSTAGGTGPTPTGTSAGTYKIIHELQPGALVGNNHHVAPFPGEDFQMFEQDLPGENTAGFNKAGVAAPLPLETCLTMNNSWGYNAGDKDFKSPEADHPLPAGGGRAGGEPAPERRPAARRHHRPRVRRAAARGRPVARAERRDGLRHARRADPAAALGRLDDQELRAGPGVSPHPQARGQGHPPRGHELYIPYAFGKDTPLKLVESKEGLELGLPADIRAQDDTIVILRPRVPPR